jgi:hypothetical protein
MDFDLEAKRLHHCPQTTRYFYRLQEAFPAILDFRRRCLRRLRGVTSSIPKAFHEISSTSQSTPVILENRTRVKFVDRVRQLVLDDRGWDFAFVNRLFCYRVNQCFDDLTCFLQTLAFICEVSVVRLLELHLQYWI